ncbi:uncharacterized protein LOC130590841 [Beta vulgaris subsp. vulgaris]|uniref:uncharacterized protein LOC130590841 n=1 Tax=Beta vulgaris subsp. vulgaris TaxID=3555 RepID=UPI0025470D72|nr:uncharacterized protein LOC130590841 [Beta vulgaris subsp. vulgaris]
MGGASSSIQVYGFSWLYGSSGGEIELPEIVNGLINTQMYNSSGISIPLIFITVGIGFKLSPPPSHQWTPDVYEGVQLDREIPISLTAWRKDPNEKRMTKCKWAKHSNSKCLEGNWLPQWSDFRQDICSLLKVSDDRAYGHKTIREATVYEIDAQFSLPSIQKSSVSSRKVLSCGAGALDSSISVLVAEARGLREDAGEDLKQFEDVQIRHASREANAAADWMAHRGHMTTNTTY